MRVMSAGKSAEKQFVSPQTADLRAEQSAGLAPARQFARAAVQFCDRAATIAENMTAFQPVAEESKVTLEAQQRGPHSTVSSRDKRVFSRDTRTIRNPRNLHEINHITPFKVGQNRMFSKCPILVQSIVKLIL
jgi:hypothetical protein